MIVILDTNVVLNLWFFKDPKTLHALAPIWSSSKVYGTPAMLKEVLRVAKSPHLLRYATEEAAFENLEHSWRSAVKYIEPNGVISPLRCRDPDDQMFLNLAEQVHANALFSLDRDLLKLHKRALTFGLKISTP